MSESLEIKNTHKIKLYLKDFYKVWNIDYLFKYLIPSLAHDNDGIIFTKNSAPY